MSPNRVYPKGLKPAGVAVGPSTGLESGCTNGSWLIFEVLFFSGHEDNSLGYVTLRDQAGPDRSLTIRGPKCVIASGFQLAPKDNHVCVAPKNRVEPI